jgi:ectoine hydroxylase-related dioxygenase (phytanoyl-CoA dioxygenase family)
MTDIEIYEFDRQGYLVLPDFLMPDEVRLLKEAVDRLEGHALEHVDQPPRKRSARGSEYHVNEELGYHAKGEKADGKTLIIEDYWNADPAFDLLVNHEPTMRYARGIVQGHVTINNSEIRIRYTGNQSGTHRPTGDKYTYRYNETGIDCRMVRFIYFIHDVTEGQGAFCVVPGTHKSNLQSPYENDPDKEPGMVSLEAKAGDAILFTENLRHGGVTNRSAQTRKTIHVGYGPYWLMSQNTSTMDEPQHVLDRTLERYDEKQRALFTPWPDERE